MAPRKTNRTRKTTRSCSCWRESLKVAYAPSTQPVCSTHNRLRDVVPVECYIMQGDHPLPNPVIEKFAKTGSALAKGVNLLRMSYPAPNSIARLNPVARIDKSGVIMSPQGVRIACLGGIYDSNLYAASESAHVSTHIVLHSAFSQVVNPGFHLTILHLPNRRQASLKHTHNVETRKLTKLHLSRGHQSKRSDLAAG